MGVRRPITNLTDNTVYYVIRLSNGIIQLATNLDDVIVGRAIDISYPAQTSTGAHTLIPMGPGTQFTGNRVVNVTSTITLSEHPFQTGQAVLYRAEKGQTIQEVIPGGPNRDLAINGLFYVIRVDADTIKLAKNVSDAIAGQAIKLVKPADTTHHAFTAVTGFANFGKIEGGREYDTTSLQPTNDARGPLAVDVPSAYMHTFTDINPDISSIHAADLTSASGGRVNGLAGASAMVFYAATEYGGLYKSTDRGDTWDVLENHLPKITRDVEVHPMQTNRVFATSFFDGLLDGSAGIQVSIDAGVNWIRPITSTPDPVLNGRVLDNTPQAGYFVEAKRRAEFSAFEIAIRPDNANFVIVGTNSGVAISDDGGVTWQFIDPTPMNPATDVWGINYQGVTANFPYGIIDIIGDDGHLRSFDGGYTWGVGHSIANFTPVGPGFVQNPLPGGRGRGQGSVAVSPHESYVIFAVVASGQTVAGNDGNDRLFESDDGGRTWTALGNPEPQGRVPFVETNRRGAGFDLWFGDISLYRASGVNRQHGRRSDSRAGVQLRCAELD